jgi:RNA polymerase sigma factor (sigma-70 family)
MKMPLKKKSPILPRKNSKDFCLNYNLRIARSNLNLAVRELAEKTGLKPEAIYAYEGCYAFPSPRKARKIAWALSLKPGRLFPERFRELNKEIRRERERRKEDEKYQLNFVYLGSKLSELEESLTEMKREDLMLEEDFNLRQAIQDELRERIEQVLQSLNYRERKIIKMRYGLGEYSGDRYTLKECGEEFGVSRERIRQIEKKALRKLQEPDKIKILRDFVQ